MSAIRVLLAEDETHLGTILEQYLTARGFTVSIVRNGRAALDALRAETFDVALLDVVMPEMDGLEVLRRLREDPMPPEVIVITGNGTIETAMTALKLGAYDFLSKPYRMAEIEALVRRAWEKRILARDNVVLQSQLKRTTGEPQFLTQFAPLRAVLAMVERIAPSHSPVLISGESGTGKNLIARVLHLRGERPDGPFVDVNSAALASASAEAELFGVERGAIPGADDRRMGLLELASGGTLYLDHVGALDLRVQGKLLQAIERGAFHRLGGVQQVKVDVRMVASTTHDLSRMVQTGAFRDDLLHRLNTIRVVLPPLRDRTVDIPLLASHFLAHLCAHAGGRAAPVLSVDAQSALEQYRWPGNVRELRNVLERSVLLSTHGTVGALDLLLGLDVGAATRPSPISTPTLAELERQHITDVLERTMWHQGRAAELLGISPKTLYRKIREYGFTRPPGRA